MFTVMVNSRPMVNGSRAFAGTSRNGSAGMSTPLGQDLAAAAFDATGYPVMITDAAGTIVTVNTAFTRQTGWRADEIRGQTPRVLASGRQDADFFEGMWTALLREGSWCGELWNRRKCGQIYPDHVTIDGLRGADGTISHFIAVYADVEARRARDERLSHLANHDEVTGLPTRALFLDRIERALAVAGRRGIQVSVQLLDLDAFARVNDAFGYESGDLILRAVGERIRSSLRDSDTVARWGGNRFVIGLPIVDGAKGARETGLRLLSMLRRPFYMAGDEVRIGASIGAALFPSDAVSATQIVDCAEFALVAAKRDRGTRLLLHGDIIDAQPQRKRA